MIESIHAKLRHTFFHISHEIQKQAKFSSFFYKSLLLIEAIQIAFYSINPSFDFLWSATTTTILQEAMQYFQLAGPIQKMNTTVFEFALYLSIGISLLGLMSIIYCSSLIRNLVKENRSIDALSSQSLFYSCIRYLALYGILVLTIGTMPLYSIFFTTIFCDTNTVIGNSMSCYQGKYFIHLSFSIFGLLLHSAFLGFFNKFFVDFNPCSDSPFAQPRSSTPILKLAMKLCLTFSTSLDQEGDKGKLFLVVFILFQLGVLANRYITSPYFSLSIARYIILLETGTLWLSIVASISGNYDNASVGLVFLFLGMPFVCSSCMQLFEKKQHKFMTKSHKFFKRDEDFEMFLILLIQLIENKNHAESRVLLEGVLKYHALSCSKPQDTHCNCQQLLLDSDMDEFQSPSSLQNYKNTGGGGANRGVQKDDGNHEEGEVDYVKHALRVSSSSGGGMRTTQAPQQTAMILRNARDYVNAESTKRWYTFVRFILSDAFDRFSRSSRLRLFHAYILHEKLSNPFKAFLELIVASEQQSTIQEQFSIYRFTRIIQESIRESQFGFDPVTNSSSGYYAASVSSNAATNGKRSSLQQEQQELSRENVNKNNNNSNADHQRGPSDVHLIVEFQNKLVAFFAGIETSVAFHSEFWNKLMAEMPDVQKLLTLGTKITNSVEANAIAFAELQRINSNSIKCLAVYGFYLRDIINDDVEGQLLIEKANFTQRNLRIHEQLAEEDGQKYGDNSGTAIIVISANLNNLGNITKVNSEIFELLGYSKQEMIGQNISKIMPSVFGDLHDSFISRFLETSVGRLIGMDRILMAQNKSGFAVPISIFVKVLPNLDDGVQIVGFLRAVDSSMYSKDPTKNRSPNQSNSNILMNSDDDDDDNNDLIVHYMIYRSDTLQVCGISESCYRHYGIPVTIVSGNASNSVSLAIDAIMPGVVHPENHNMLTSQFGLNTYIDSTFVQRNFLIDENDLETTSFNGSEGEDTDEFDSNYEKEDEEDEGNSNNYNNSNSDFEGGVNGEQAIIKQRLIYSKEKTNQQNQQLRQFEYQQNKKMKKSKSNNNNQLGKKRKNNNQKKFNIFPVNVQLISSYEFENEGIQVNVISFMSGDHPIQPLLNMDGIATTNTTQNNVIGIENQSPYQQSIQQRNSYLPNGFGGPMQQRNTIKTTNNQSKMLPRKKTLLKQVRMSTTSRRSKATAGSRNQFDDANLNHLEPDSNSSDPSDEQRNLKDVKALISERTVPKSIKILHHTAIIVMLILCAISSYDISFKIYNESTVQEGLKSIHSVYLVSSTLPKINFYASLLHQVANSLILPNALESQTAIQMAKPYRRNLTNLAASLQVNMFDYMQNQVNMAVISGSNTTNLTYHMFKMSSIGAKAVENLTFTDALLNFMTQTSTFSEQNLSTLVDGQVSLGLGKYYSVKSNGLKSMRIAANANCVEFFDFFFQRISNFSLKNNFVLIVAIVNLVVSSVILIPIVFQVNKTNNKVLSLFGYIPFPEIRALALKCDRFIAKHLSNMTTSTAIASSTKTNEILSPGARKSPSISNSKQKIVSMKSLKSIKKSNNNNDQNNNNNNNNNNKNNDNNKSLNQISNNDDSQFVPLTGRKSKPINKPGASTTSVNKLGLVSSTTSGKQQKHMQSKPENKSSSEKRMYKYNSRNENEATHYKEGGLSNNAEEIDDDDDDDFIEIRSSLLLNQKDGSRASVILRFGVIGALLAFVYVMHYIYDLRYIAHLQDIYNHFLISWRRPLAMQYYYLYLSQEIIEAQIYYTNEGADQRNVYTDLVYQIESEIRPYYTFSFPAELDSYQSSFRLAQTQDLCLLSKNVSSIQACQQVYSGALQRGFLTSVVSFVEELRKFANGFAVSDKSIAARTAILNDANFRGLQDQLTYSIPLMQQLNVELMNGLNDFTDARTKRELILFIVYILALVLSVIFVWMPYMNRLNMKIWRTKGMLNMIPISVINKHESLRNAFVSNDILSAVK